MLFSVHCKELFRLYTQTNIKYIFQINKKKRILRNEYGKFFYS